MKEWLKQRLFQRSTIKALLKMLAAFGLWSATDSTQDLVAEAIMGLIAFGFSASAAWDAFTDEKKRAEKTVEKVIEQDRPWLDPNLRAAVDAAYEAGKKAAQLERGQK